MSETIAEGTRFCREPVRYIQENLKNETDAVYRNVFRIKQEPLNLTTDFCTRDEWGDVTYYSNNGL